MFMQETENSRYFQEFQQFSSLQLQNYTTCSCRKRKTHVTFKNFSTLHYNSRTIHNACSCRKRKTHVTFKNFSSSLQYNCRIYTKYMFMQVTENSRYFQELPLYSTPHSTPHTPTHPTHPIHTPQINRLNFITIKHFLSKNVYKDKIQKH